MEDFHIFRDEGHIARWNCPCSPLRHGYIVNHAFDPEIRKTLAQPWVWPEQWHYVKGLD